MDLVPCNGLRIPHARDGGPAGRRHTPMHPEPELDPYPSNGSPMGGMIRKTSEGNKIVHVMLMAGGFLTVGGRSPAACWAEGTVYGSSSGEPAGGDGSGSLSVSLKDTLTAGGGASAPTRFHYGVLHERSISSQETNRVVDHSGGLGIICCLTMLVAGERIDSEARNPRLNPTASIAATRSHRY